MGELHTTALTIPGSNLSANLSVAQITHPEYTWRWQNWFKFRLCFRGGREFIREYLERFSRREDFAEFHRRKQITYAPTHAKGAVIDIINSIFERMRDITRLGGPESYKRAIIGQDKGVDLDGNTMNGYIGRIVLKEMATMGKVGVYIDKFPQEPGANILEVKKNRPFLYHYRAEDIRSWSKNIFNELESLLLRDHIHRHDPSTGLVIGHIPRFRLLRRIFSEELGRNIVEVKFFDRVGAALPEETVILDLPEIPFVHFGLSESLLTDVADYQIALLNLESSDMSYVLKSNFPLYVEQFDPVADLVGGVYTRPPRGPSAPIEDNLVGLSHLGGGSALGGASSGHGATFPDGTSANAQVSGNHTIEMGASSGRRYTKGLNEPNFINPSPDPIIVSMKKQENIKDDIRRLVNLTAQSVTANSAVQRRADDAGLLAGLAAIGMELEWGEREIARIWSLYEGFTGEIKIQYPQSYSILTDEERQEEAKRLGELGPTIPSETFKKVVAKRQAQIVIGHLVSSETLEKVSKEIEAATVITTDPDVISKDFENGFVSTETASQARGYPKGEVEKAKADHADRIARIAVAQSPVPIDRPAARGVPDADGDEHNSSHDEKKESRDNTQKDNIKDRTRGEGK